MEIPVLPTWEAFGEDLASSQKRIACPGLWGTTKVVYRTLSCILPTSCSQTPPQAKLPTPPRGWMMVTGQGRFGNLRSLGKVPQLKERVRILRSLCVSTPTLGVGDPRPSVISRQLQWGLISLPYLTHELAWILSFFFRLSHVTFRARSSVAAFTALVLLSIPVWLE